MSSTTLPMLALTALLALVGALVIAASVAAAMLAGRRARRAVSEARSLASVLDKTLGSLDALDLWWLRIDADDRVIAANSPTRMDAPPSSEVVGKPLLELLPESTHQALEVQLGRARSEDRLTGFEFAHGDSLYASLHISPMGEECVVLIRDLSAKKLKEARLLATKERYALAAQGANDGLWDWNLVTGEIYWSWMFRRMLGDESLEPTREAWFDRVHPDDRDGFIASLDAHIAGDGGSFSHEHRIQQGEGWAWVLARGMAVRNADGKANRLAGSLTDLTNRRVVQVTAEKASLLEHATRAVDIGIGVVHASGDLDNPSPTLLRIAAPWGIDAWWSVARARSPKAARRCTSCKRPERVGSVRIEIETPDGTPRVHEIRWTGHAHEVFQEAGAHIVMINDVTESALAERSLRSLNVELAAARDAALEASRLKSAFLANMSHELRTPLNHIVGYAELVDEALDDLDDAQTRRDVARILESGRELTQIVGRLLDLSRLEAEGMTAEQKPTHLAPLIEETVGDIDARGNTVNIQVSADLIATTDGPKLGILLRQIVDNATKFTTNGVVEISARRAPERVIITISDTGIGMPPEVVSRLFKGYFQADISHTREYDGTGLGLVLAHGIARVLSAELHVESTPGEGSVFSVAL